MRGSADSTTRRVPEARRLVGHVDDQIEPVVEDTHGEAIQVLALGDVLDGDAHAAVRWAGGRRWMLLSHSVLFGYYEDGSRSCQAGAEVRVCGQSRCDRPSPTLKQVAAQADRVGRATRSQIPVSAHRNLFATHPTLPTPPVHPLMPPLDLRDAVVAVVEAHQRRGIDFLVARQNQLWGDVEADHPDRRYDRQKAGGWRELAGMNKDKVNLRFRSWIWRLRKSLSSETRYCHVC